jgi:hypothetical protein
VPRIQLSRSLLRHQLSNQHDKAFCYLGAFVDSVDFIYYCGY